MHTHMHMHTHTHTHTHMHTHMLKKLILNSVTDMNASDELVGTRFWQVSHLSVTSPPSSREGQVDDVAHTALP